MDVLTAILERRSIRSFKSDPVPQKTLRSIIQSACQAPSAMNTQPWEFVVLAGEVLNNIKKGNVEKLKAGAKPQPEHSVIGWPSDSIYRRRQIDLAVDIFKLMGIAREDKDKRAAWSERGFRYFDAPAAIVVIADRSLSEAGPLIDIGAMIQNLCLAALHYDLGTCIEDQGTMYPEVLREYATIPDSKKIIISIAIGYPDWDFVANKLKSRREDINNITSWCGF